MSNLPITESHDFWSRLKEVVAEVIKEQMPAPLKLIGDEARALLKVKEVCALFAISRPTLYQWMHAGKLTSIKIGSRRYFKREQIQELLEQYEDFSKSQRA